MKDRGGTFAYRCRDSDFHYSEVTAIKYKAFQIIVRHCLHIRQSVFISIAIAIYEIPSKTTADRPALSDCAVSARLSCGERKWSVGVPLLRFSQQGHRLCQSSCWVATVKVLCRSRLLCGFPIVAGTRLLVPLPVRVGSLAGGEQSCPNPADISVLLFGILASKYRILSFNFPFNCSDRIIFDRLIQFAFYNRTVIQLFWHSVISIFFPLFHYQFHFDPPILCIHLFEYMY